MPPYFPDETLYPKLQRYALYQERCTSDIEKKLKEWKVPAKQANKLTERLIREGIVDDLRFAESFVRGKFRLNKWGRKRIRMELKAKKIPADLIEKALQEIDEEDYLGRIRELIRKKSREINPEKIANKREKILTFVVGKGFEYDLVLRILQQTEI